MAGAPGNWRGQRDTRVRFAAAENQDAQELANLYKSPARLTRRSVILGIAILFFLGLLLLDGIYVASNLPDRLEEAQTSLSQGAEHFEAGEMRAANEDFGASTESAREAQQLADHPSLLLASYAPIILNDALVLRTLPEVVAETATAGSTAVQGVEALGGSEEGQLAAALYRDGRVQLESIKQARDYVDDVRDHLAAARRMLEEAPEPLVERLQEAVADAHIKVAEAEASADRGSKLLRALPPLMGDTRTRRYFLAFQSPSEARATGGIVGLYGILEASDGVVTLTRVGPFVELFTDLDTSEIRSVEAKEEFLDRYRGAVTRSNDVNLSPDFAAVSKVLLQLYERAAGERLDGVVTTDPLTLQWLLRATGPLEVPDYPIPLTGENAASVLLHDSYLAFANRPEDQTRFLLNVIRGFYASLAAPSLDAPQLIQSFGDAVASRHLQLYSTQPQEQKLLEELGISGTLKGISSNVQLIYSNNKGRNKVDYFLHRSLDVAVKLTRDGYALVETKVVIRNDAPRGTSNVMLDSYAGSVARGVNLMELNALIPKGARLESWRINGSKTEVPTGTEADHPASWTELKIPPQQRAVVVISYRIPEVVDLLGSGIFSIALVPQPLLNADDYQVTFTPPAGYQVDGTGGARVGPGALRYSGELERTKLFEVKITPI